MVIRGWPSYASLANDVEDKELKQYADVAIEGDAKKYIESLDQEVLVIYSPTSLSLLGVQKTVADMVSSRSLNSQATLMEFIRKKNYKLVLSLGGGTATDIAKYIAAKMNATFVCIPSMLSTNAYSTNKVALVIGQEKVTLNAKLADKIIFDKNFIKKAQTQNLYGLADVLSIYTALSDWQLAYRRNSELINKEIYRESENLLNELIEFVLSHSIDELSQDINSLFNYIGRSGHITNLYGSGRPESGSEHIFANTLEKIIDVPHGISVSLGILLMSLAQNRYSPVIFDCIVKLGTLQKLNEYSINKDVVSRVMSQIKPRKDRYTIVNEIESLNWLSIKILDDAMQLIEDANEISYKNRVFQFDRGF